MKNNVTVVCGGGGFIGGHLVADLRRQGIGPIRSVDVKPFEGWYQKFDGVENLVLDLQDKAACYQALQGAHTVYNLALRYMREPVLAEDMAQEAFVRLWRNPSQVREAGALTPPPKKVAAE